MLDYYHLWVPLVDPFFHEWRNIVKFVVPIRVLAKEMIAFFVPLDDDGSETTREELLKDFEVSDVLNFLSCMSIFLMIFDIPPGFLCPHR